jgi:hypothetical protein
VARYLKQMSNHVDMHGGICALRNGVEEGIDVPFREQDDGEWRKEHPKTRYVQAIRMVYRENVK